MLNILRDVHRRALRGHLYVEDERQYGKLEHWDIGLVGDCEDFALWCRQELEKFDIKSDLILCLTEDGGGHLVCSVDGWVLDNRQNRVRSRDFIPYTWLKIGKPDGAWYEITA